MGQLHTTWTARGGRGVWNKEGGVVVSQTDITSFDLTCDKEAASWSVCEQAKGAE